MLTEDLVNLTGLVMSEIFYTTKFLQSFYREFEICVLENVSHEVTKKLLLQMDWEAKKTRKRKNKRKPLTLYRTR